ncbi:MAG TPA: porin family protein [Chryseolinea sp.]
MRTLIILLFLGAVQTTAHGQVLISLLLGDKLNTGQIEFGLDGGLSLSNIHGLDPSGSKTGFNLGFYFDFRLKNPSWMFHTGVMVKSTMGSDDVSVYSLSNPDLDNAFSGGSVIRKLGYFNVPAMMKYKMKNNFFVEAGPMFGLMNNSTSDEFVATIEKKDDLTYKLKTKGRYHPLDAGVIAGIGYRLLNGNGMNLAIRYYVGLVDITIDDVTTDQYNRSLYFAIGIPVGAGKKSKVDGN